MTPAADDQVVVEMNDGSVIVADEIVSMSDEELRLKSGPLSDVTVKWLQVVSLRSPKIVRIELRDGTVLKGTISPERPGRVLVRVPAMLGDIRVILRRVASLNASEDVSTKYKGSLSLGTSVMDGNTQTKNVSLLGDFEAWSASQRLTLRARWNYAESSGAGLTARNTRGSIKYDYFIDDRWYAFTSAFLEEDIFQDLNLRTALSAGPGYQFVRPGDYPNDYLNGERWFNNVDFRGEFGLAFFDEDFRVGADRRYVSAKWSAHIDWEFLPNVSIFHRHQGFPSLEKLDDVFIRSEQGVRMQIFEGLVATLQVNWQWDNTPSPGFERSEYLYILGLGYSFRL